MTDYDRNKFGLLELWAWENWASMREEMSTDYKYTLTEAVKKIGNVHFGLYIRELINQNPLLTADQKEEILEKFTERNHNKWGVEETQQRFNRLMFVMLGVLREKSPNGILGAQKKAIAAVRKPIPIPVAR